MSRFQKMVLLCATACFLAGSFSLVTAEKLQSQTSENAQRALWDLEHEYWRRVQDNNLSAYRELWHDDFLGWPCVSAAPVRKDHITDWITSQTSKGLHFNSGELKPAGIQLTGDIAVVYYWMTYEWLAKDGKGAPHTFRITHAWLKNENQWLIIGGMSMQETTPQQ